MVLDKLTQRAKDILSNPDIAVSNKVSVFNLIKKLMETEGLSSIVLKDYQGFLESNKLKDSKVSFEELVKQSYLEAMELRHPYVGTEHLLLGVLKLVSQDEYKDIQKKIVSTGTYPKEPRKTLTSTRRTPVLDIFGKNLNQLYEEGMLGNPVEREGLSDLIMVLLQKRKANPLLIGDIGIGKGSLAYLLVKKISDLEVPSALANAQVIEFDLNGFLGSVFGREGIEVGLSSLHDEVISSPNLILLIRDLHLLFMPVALGSIPYFVVNAFKSNILFSNIPVIATSTSLAFQRYLSEDEDILSYFSPLKVKETSKTETLKILFEKATELERFHSIKIPHETINKAYETGQKYLKSKRFPQKGIDLLDKASSLLLMDQSLIPKKFSLLKKKKLLLSQALVKAVKLKNFESAVSIKRKLKLIEKKFGQSLELPKKIELDASYISKALSKELDVPVGDLTSFEENIYKGLEDKLTSKIVGQEKAVKALVSSLLRSRLGLRSKKRPIGNFLFLGPTGVGKTELAKVLAESVFGKDGLIKLDMSDFSERHTVSRLVGAPPGYVGYSEGGELTEKIAKNPYSVVLFDEIEKAHPDVLNILLQIMDDGVLVDARGKAFDFTNSIVILTSNLGSELINKEELGFSVKTNIDEIAKRKATETEKVLLLNLKSILRPELLNRLDDIIVFNKLPKLEVEKILKILLSEIEYNLAEKGFSLKVSKAAKDYLLKQGYSEEYGVRALKRTLDRTIVDEIAKAMLEGKVSSPGVIKVGFDKVIKVV